jgi:hypothetical protein
MKPVLIRDADFRVVRTSRNLRGIIGYSRTHAVERVDIYPSSHDCSAQLGIAWADGATCITDFASFEICKNWCAARRAFPKATIHTREGSK